MELLEEYLGRLAAHPDERRRRHEAVRQAATVALTGEAPTLEEWASGSILRLLARSEVYRQHSVLLDAGCGPGVYLGAMVGSTVVPTGFGIGLDRSREALEKAQARLQGLNHALLQGNLRKLPLANSSCGAVMCNRMLNQTGEIKQALAEVRRVLRPGGLLLIVTAGSTSQNPLPQLHEKALQELGFPPRLYQHTTLPGQRFDLQNGTKWLSSGFEEVEIQLYERRMSFSRLQDLQEYYATGLLFHRSENTPGISTGQWAALFEQVTGSLARQLNEHTPFIIQEGAALFSARRPL